MKYNYRITKEFDEALNWVLFSQFKDNVFFRFSFEGYRGVSRTPWMSPSQCLDYMRHTGSYFEFEFFTMRVCA